jgi:hypothetical protein
LFLDIYYDRREGKRRKSEEGGMMRIPTFGPDLESGIVLEFGICGVQHIEPLAPTLRMIPYVRAR